MTSQNVIEKVPTSIQRPSALGRRSQCSPARRLRRWRAEPRRRTASSSRMRPSEHACESDRTNRASVSRLRARLSRAPLDTCVHCQPTTAPLAGLDRPLSHLLSPIVLWRAECASIVWSCGRVTCPRHWCLSAQSLLASDSVVPSSVANPPPRTPIPACRHVMLALRDPV